MLHENVVLNADYTTVSRLKSGGRTELGDMPGQVSQGDSVLVSCASMSATFEVTVDEMVGRTGYAANARSYHMYKSPTV